MPPPNEMVYLAIRIYEHYANAPAYYVIIHCVVYRVHITTAYRENLLRRKLLSVGNLRIYISLKRGQTKSKFPAKIGFACKKIFITATALRDMIKLLPVLQKKKKTFSPFLGLCTVAAHIRKAPKL